MKTIKKQTQTAGGAEHKRLLNEIREDAAKLAGIPPSGWTVVWSRINRAAEDAAATGIEQGVSAEDRHWLAGGAYHLREVLNQLHDLYTGAYRQWPEFPQDTPKKEEEHDGPDER